MISILCMETVRLAWGPTVRVVLPHRIEIDAGIGYPSKLNLFLEQTDILIDGDGADLDGTETRCPLESRPAFHRGRTGFYRATNGRDHQKSSLLDRYDLDTWTKTKSMIIEFATDPVSTIGRTVLGVDTNASATAN